MIPASFTAANSEVKFADGQNSKVQSYPITKSINIIVLCSSSSPQQWYFALPQEEIKSPHSLTTKDLYGKL